MSMRPVLIWGLAAGLLQSVPAAAAAAEAVDHEVIDRGAGHFAIFCTNCHGVDADGKGPLVSLLKVRPTDLRVLAQSGSDETVTEQVLKAVSGRHEVGAEGERRMPVFTHNLEPSTVYEIAKYLETLQR